MGRLGILVIALALAAPLRAAAEEYDPQEAGNPLRVTAYILHPVGVVLDYLVFRPAWWVGQREPARTLFGVEGSGSLEEAQVEALERDEARASEVEAP